MKKNKNILVTGGAGYIGSHMVRFLLEKGYKPVVFDNLKTGFREFVPRGVPFVKGDLRKPKDIDRLFKKYRFDSVMHFAALIVVSESVRNLSKYYKNNVLGSINLLKTMIDYGVDKFVFSSTAAVYGEPKKIPIDENHPTNPVSPYAETKLIVEEILKNISCSAGRREYFLRQACLPVRQEILAFMKSCQKVNRLSSDNFKYVSFRYFNVAGSHPSADIGIKVKSATHLIPSIMKVAKGSRKCLTIFGDDYNTPDGTCIRDYIYVMDLCRAHLLALKALEKGMKEGIFNLGNGDGLSVKEVIRASEEVTGKKIKVKLGKRRQGDISRIIASSKKTQRILKWSHKASLEIMLKSAWEWEKSL